MTEKEHSDTKKSTQPSLGKTGALQLKVCGMQRNTEAIAVLEPDYLGFIFWEPSKRYFKGPMVELPDNVKKVGVFVDAAIDTVIEKIDQYQLSLVQLHGKESADYCAELKKKAPHVQLVKVFSIKDDFDFTNLAPYEDVCDYYLFDTKGKLPGGNGYTFDWKVLEKYPSTKPYFLSGGIGPNELPSIQEFVKRPESKYCHALDVNSGFEIEPGLKDVDKIKIFKKALNL